MRTSMIGYHWRPKSALDRQRERLRRAMPRLTTADAAKVAKAEELGRRSGLGDYHYLPHLDFDTSGEWLAWLSGWRAGQAELREMRDRL